MSHISVYSLLCLISCLHGFDSNNLVIVIVSQTEPYHASVSALLKQEIQIQALEHDEPPPVIYQTHEDLKFPGAWRIIPLFKPLLERHLDSDVKWFFFVEPHTTVRYTSLMKTLQIYNASDPQWIGYPTSDREPAIIHHFIQFNNSNGERFTFPNFASGFAINKSLMKSISTVLDHRKIKKESDFSIDASFELALLLYQGFEPKTGYRLKAEHSFCVIANDHCTTYPKLFPVCGDPIREDTILFAVKTYHGFHETRLKVIKDTWGKHVSYIMHFSDKEDKSIPTIDLNIPNTSEGHCAKTIAILNYLKNYLKKRPDVKWVFLADDDTILGVKRLTEFLSCIRGGDSIAMIGERYGYGYNSNTGFDYITSGGGMVMSTSALALLSRCKCSTPNSPDDMTLGSCAKYNLNITLTHSPLFHQARPHDYTAEYLSRDRPISFHKHWMIDPKRVYTEWFESDDLTLNDNVHVEL